MITIRNTLIKDILDKEVIYLQINTNAALDHPVIRLLHFMINLANIVLVVNIDYPSRMQNLEHYMTIEDTDVTETVTTDVTPTEELNTDVTTDITEEAPAVDAVVPQEKALTQEEFNKVYFEQKQAEREAIALRKQLEELKAPKPAQAQTVAAKTLEDFDFDDQAYQDHLIDQKVEAKLAQYQAKSQEQDAAKAQKTQADIVMNDFNTKANEYAAQNPSYSEAMTNAQHINYSPSLSDAVLHEGPQLDHHLLTNPQLVDKLNSMSGYAMAKELAVVVGNLNKKATIKHSSAPTPPPTVTGGAKHAVDMDDPGMSMDKYYELEMARLRSKK